MGARNNGGLGDIGANSEDLVYAKRQMHKWRCWQAERRGWPRPETPAFMKGTSNEATSTNCASCDIDIIVLKGSLRKAEKEGRGMYCPECRRKKHSEFMKESQTGQKRKPYER